MALIEAAEAKRRQADAAKKAEEEGLEKERRGPDRDRIVEDEEGGDGDGDEAEDDEDGQELPFPGGG